MARRTDGIRYLPVDISPAALQQAMQRLQSRHSTIHVQPLVADFSEGFSFLRRVPGRRLVLYLGSSIGNFTCNDAVALLAQVRAELREGDALLLGTDMVKSPSILLPAYDDAQGVTAAFNRNILRRLNREFGANFDLAAFAHRAVWNAEQARIEMHMVSRHAQRVRLAVTGDEFAFAAGETIHTENSCKYTSASIRGLLGAAGFHLAHTWFDRRHWFALHWATPGLADLCGKSQSRSRD
jgi:dimethylhistidine N-methyltransferase